jgi:hypothetical protein
MMGRRRRMETTLLKKNSKLDSVGNEENAYPVPDPKKSKISFTREHSDAHKKTLKEQILYESTEKFMEKTWVTKMYKLHSRNFKTPKIKNMRRH